MADAPSFSADGPGAASSPHPLPPSPEHRQTSYIPSVPTSATPSIRAMYAGFDNLQSGTTTPGVFEEGSSLLGAGRQTGPEEGYGAVEDQSGGQASTRGRKRALFAKMKYYIPSIAWIPQYNLSLVGGDFLAGLTVACMLIPQSVSYATSLARLSPVTGLFSASIPGLIYALFGTSRQLNVAPEAALSLLVGQAVNDILHGHRTDAPIVQDIDEKKVGAAIATVITFQVGIISFLLGFLRLGFLDVVLSRALLRGFVTAVAVVIMIEQLIPMFGLTALEHTLHPLSTLDKLVFLIENVYTHSHRLTTLVSFGALGVLGILRFAKTKLGQRWWIVRGLPEVLVVVLGATVICYKLDWANEGLDILGKVKVSSDGAFFQFPLGKNNLRYLHRTTGTAVLISIIGFLDSIVSAKQNASKFGHEVSPNRELVALGMANLGAAWACGGNGGMLPAYGSITRSRINGDVGGRTQMASIVCSVIVLLTTYFLLPLLEYLPKCVLASIILLVVFTLLQEFPHDFRFYIRLRGWMDILLMTLTFVLTIVWNLEVGIAVSLVISLLLVVRRSAKPRMTILGRLPGTTRWIPIDDHPEAEEDVHGALIVRIRENLDFANTAQLKERLRRLELYGHAKHHPSDEPHRPHASVLVFHMADVDSIDASAVQIFYELVETYLSRGVSIYITHLKKSPRESFARAGLFDLLAPDAICPDVASAMTKVERDTRER